MIAISRASIGIILALETQRGFFERPRRFQARRVEPAVRSTETIVSPKSLSTLMERSPRRFDVGC
jgi:hypothetical protein